VYHSCALLGVGQLGRVALVDTPNWSELASDKGLQPHVVVLAKVAIGTVLHLRVELLGTAVQIARCISGKSEYRHRTDRVQVERSKGAKNSAKRVKST
jgi:hypothetical protein